MPTALRKYIFTHEQLQTYLQIFTGDNEVVVLKDAGAMTHLPSKVVRLPIGTPIAATSASHEGLHLLHSSHEALRAQPTAAHRTVLNILDDGRIERQSFVKTPGLRVQFQQDINDLAPLLLKEDWLSQALKGMYLKVGGYNFPFAKMEPKALAILNRFGPFVTPVRKAETDKELTPIVAQVVALFDEKLLPPPPSEAEEEEDEDEDGQNPEVGCDLSFGKHDSNGNPKDSNPFEERMREGMEKAQAQADKLRAKQGPIPNGEYAKAEMADEIERDAVTYSADDARSAVEEQRRLADEDAERGPGPSGPRIKVKGRDTVTGGPTVNQLVLQANQVKTNLEKLEAKVKRKTQYRQTRLRNAGSDEALEISSTDAAPPKPPEHGVSSATLPKSMAEGMESFDRLARGSGKYAQTDIDWEDLLDEAGGGTGYYGRSGWTVSDWTTAKDAACHALAIEGLRTFLPSVNYLTRQLRIIMQSQDRKGMRDYERFGLLDPRRAYHMGSGRFDVYRNTPAPRDTRPIVLLTTDVSGSMLGGVQTRYDYASGQYRHEPPSTRVPAFHAMNATMVLGETLHRMRVPFEAHAFDSTGYLIKTFSQPWGVRAIGACSNIWAVGGGSTSAAEALAVGWARILTRPEPRKIVIQVTDGAVAQNTRKMADAIEKSGGTLIGVGIGVGNMKAFYPHYVEVRNASELPNVFARLMKRLLPTGEWRS